MRDGCAGDRAGVVAVLRKGRGEEEEVEVALEEEGGGAVRLPFRYVWKQEHASYLPTQLLVWRGAYFRNA